jgi:superfamily I DNA and/or RNA helicase
MSSLIIRQNSHLAVFYSGTGKTRTIVATVSALLASSLVQRKNSSSCCTSSLHPSQLRNPTSSSSQSSSVAKSWQGLDLARQLMKESGLQQQASCSEGAAKSLRGRVLICAQSNAAVDELLLRLSDGLIGSNGQKYKPYIVRVGNQKTIHSSSLPYFINTLVEQKVSEDMKAKADGKAGAEFESTISLRARLEKVVDDIRKYEARRAKLNSDDCEDESSAKISVSQDASGDIPDDQINAKLNQLYGQKREITSDLRIAHTNERRLSEENRALKQRVRKQILMDAQIVLTTLSGAGGDLYSVCSEAASSGKFGNVSENTLFDVVVIDEAAQVS